MTSNEPCLATSWIADILGDCSALGKALRSGNRR
jgi:hypothetical protein